MKTKEIGTKKTMQASQVAVYLKDIAAGIEKGEIYIQQGKEYLAMKPKTEVFVEIKAKRKKDKEKFILSLGWYNQEYISEGEDIKITPEQPEGEVVEVEDSDDDE